MLPQTEHIICKSPIPSPYERGFNIKMASINSAIAITYINCHLYLPSYIYIERERVEEEVRATFVKTFFSYNSPIFVFNNFVIFDDNSILL